jgi:UDP-3-O-[3-hydroxymyristoyl] glucosamine N-acyltransferase
MRRDMIVVDNLRHDSICVLEAGCIVGAGTVISISKGIENKIVIGRNAVIEPDTYVAHVSLS